MDTGSRCDECGFSWSTPFAFAVDTVLTAPERYAELFRSARTPAPPRPGVWTPAQYLWHVVDVLRFGVERLWTLDLDPDAGAMPWDENQAMAVRARSPHSVPVGLHALGRLAEEWGEAAWGAPAATTLAHPELGPLTRDDVVHRNAHEVVHHELDVRRGLGLVAAS